MSQSFQTFYTNFSCFNFRWGGVFSIKYKYCYFFIRSLKYSHQLHMCSEMRHKTWHVPILCKQNPIGKQNKTVSHLFLSFMKFPKNSIRVEWNGFSDFIWKVFSRVTREECPHDWMSMAKLTGLTRISVKETLHTSFF